jgi:hypothetical protein
MVQQHNVYIAPPARNTIVQKNGRVTPGQAWPRSRLVSTGRRPRIGSVLVAVLVAFIAVVGPAGSAQASADKCAGGYASQSCVGVNGNDLHVNWIKSRVSVYAFSCVYGHSQVLINGAHYADSPGWDKTWCVSGYPGKEFTTGQWNVNTNYHAGTKICSKFWVYTGTGPNGYKSLGTACATVG